MRLTILHVGRIFVDNVDSPRSGLIWQGNSDGFIFIEATAQGIEWLECIGNHQSWYTAFHEIFNDKQLASWDQNVYMLSPSSFHSKASHHNYSEFIVSQLTKEFLKHAKIKNIEFVESKIKRL